MVDINEPVIWIKNPAAVFAKNCEGGVVIQGQKIIEIVKLGQSPKTQIDDKSPKEWMDYMFDHTLIVAEDDPWLEAFKQMGDSQVAQVRVIPHTGAEKFAEYIYHKLNEFVRAETVNRVKVIKVKFMEHGKNAAYYCE